MLSSFKIKWLRPALRLAAVAVLASAPSARGDEALLAIAANFTEAAVALARDFETASGHRLELAAGSTGKLYAQIVNGAPFDAFLAADRARPELLEANGLGIAGSRFTYASGRLVLWRPNSPTTAPATLDATDATALLENVNRLAVANPDLAPYGAAAFEVLDYLALTEALRSRIVRGENVAQAYAMVASGAAEAGLVALSHVMSRDEATHWWEIPRTWHTPIRQDAILLQRGRDNDAAVDFLDFLRTDAARRKIAGMGFDVDS
ncbi:MAG: molybdate ABC transporter substrate-binding protein [Gammaproteobacteria bacterium]